MLDVVVIGGGMVGLVVVVLFKYFGIGVVVFDCLFVGFEGFWVRMVCMEMLCLFK